MKISNDRIVFNKVFIDGTITKTCHDYLYGDCHLFALVLNDYLKHSLKVSSRIVLLWQHENSECSDFGFLAHAFVVVNDKHWIDCRGKINENTIKNEYLESENSFYIEEDTNSLIQDYIKELYFSDFIDNEKEQINKFIKDNILSYCFN